MTFCKRFMLWTAVTVAVIMLIIGLCFGRLIEETLYLEIAKWVVMTLFLIGIFEVFAYTISQLVYDALVRPRLVFDSLDYTVTESNIHIAESYKVSKWCFGGWLERIREAHPETAVWSRTDGSLMREWAAHNLAYALGFKREMTKDCDLNTGQKWHVKLAYGVVGAIALWVIN